MNFMLLDSNAYKFTQDMMDYWKSQGHQIDYNIHYHPDRNDWADVIWFDTADNNIIQATTNEAIKLQKYNLESKHIIVRPIDIEVWAGIYKNIDWTPVTDIIFPSPHIKDMMLPDIPSHIRQHDIPYGVNMDRFTFRDKPRGKKIAWVTRRWSAKGKEYALQIALKLKKMNPEYKIYALGVDDYGSWEAKYFEYFIAKNHIDNIVWEEHTDDMNAWLENKDFALCCSKKETFSYAIAEGMCKGLKPVIHNFLGADKIWDSKYIWNSIDDAIYMLTSGDFNPQEYRNYVERYSLTKMMERINNEVLSNNSNPTQ